MYFLIKDFFSKHNAVFGICHGGRLDDTRYDTFTPFVNADMEKRVNPAAVLPEAKSVIVAGFGHSVPAYGGGAVLSSLGVNGDYHKKMKTALRELAAALQEKTPVKFKVLVDSGTLDERALAVRAGIGFFGKNGTVISTEFGSFFNIGCLLTDIPPEKLDANNSRDGSAENQNGQSIAAAGSDSQKFPQAAAASCPPNCRLCIDSCPGHAISENGKLDCRRCVSYLTQKDGGLTEAEKKIIGKQLYGCDICREVCPFNKHVPRTKADPVSPEEWLAMSDDELIEKYSHTAMAWRSAEILKRNARAVLF